MRSALKKAGRPILFSICEWGSNKPWEWAAEVGHSWRTTGDIGVHFTPVPVTYDENGRPRWRPQSVLEILDQNEPLRAYAGGMIAVYIGFTIISARYGDTLLAVSAILMKLLMFFSYFSDGFAYAGEALTGRFIGEGSREGIRATVRGTFLWGLGVAALFMLAYGAGGVPILHLMTDDASVVEAGREFLPWLLLMPLIGCPAFIWDGIFIGATASKDLRNSTLLCAVGFFAVWFAGVGFMKTPEAAIHLLMAAYFVHLAIRALYLTVRWPSYQY